MSEQNSNATRHFQFGILLCVLTIALDQAIKTWVTTSLPLQEAVPVLPVFSLFHTYNTGVAFSFMNTMSPMALAALALAITAIMLYLWWTSRHEGLLQSLGFGLIVGGAVGNIIDRALLGKVVDYVSLHYGDFYFAVFNLADAALTVGVGLILLQAFVVYRRPKESAE